jgi:hypothetical protein
MSRGQVMSTDQVLLGVGLIVVLAVGSQVLIPATSRLPAPQPGDTLVLLGPDGNGTDRHAE